MELKIPLGPRDLVIAVLGVGLAGSLYLHFKPEASPTGVHVEAKPSPKVAKMPTVPVAVNTPVQVLPPKAKDKLDLPPSVKNDPKKHVAGAVVTPADERKHTVTTVLDTDTGEFTTYDRREPLPWLAVSGKSEVGVFYGLKDGEQAVLVEGRHEFLQVKAAHLGVIGNVDIAPNDVDTFVGVGAWMRF